MGLLCSLFHILHSRDAELESLEHQKHIEEKHTDILLKRNKDANNEVLQQLQKLTVLHNKTDKKRIE